MTTDDNPAQVSRVVLLTITGDVVLHEVSLNRADQICDILACREYMLLPPRTPRMKFGKPRARVAAFVDRHAYVNERRLNLPASLLFYPDYEPICGDVLLFGYDANLTPGDVPATLMAVFGE